MADYTVKNLKEDVDNAAERFGLAPNLEARFTRSALGTKHSGMSYQRYAPNFRTPFGHRHREQEEVYVILNGSGKLKLDDEVIDVKQWDAIRVTGPTARGWQAGPDGLEFIAVGSPIFEESDAEMLPDWWTD